MIPDPPLLIIAPVADDTDLTQLPWCEAARERLSVNRSKFENLEMAEVVFDAMTFLVSRQTAAETGRLLAGKGSASPQGNPPCPDTPSLGIALSDILESARHLPAVNHRLLLLGKWIGESVSANAAAWLPSGGLSDFPDYCTSVERLLAGGPFPTAFQTWISRAPDGHFLTRGLGYFAGQEIRLTAPAGYDLDAISARLVPVIDNIATRGRINRPARIEGMVQGEMLAFTPSDDLGRVDIVIEKSPVTGDPAKI
ncbi:hypothetical protein [Sphingorhabdus sp. 109]|jgi:hypothetical protein|uniref:hypothetical protein n=1 Tax=Sphingorhabdus sp. 109 TaxID=2653173 RepID=UPI0012F3D57C|nr:hypothetical protein [Sphingorhabdus sp. 109]VWX56926.1 conserved hypothetical protein [Sphingorhabdus sp. 109]